MVERKVRSKSLILKLVQKSDHLCQVVILALEAHAVVVDLASAIAISKISSIQVAREVSDRKLEKEV